MSKVHLIKDESLGGIEREYIEVDRKADVGDKILVVNASITDGEYKNGDILTAKNRYKYAYSGVYVVEAEIGVRDYEYKTLEPTDIVQIDCQRYHLVDRKATFGEKVVISDVRDYNSDGYSLGDVYIVNSELNDYQDLTEVDDGGFGITLYDDEYRVLEQIENEPKCFATADSPKSMIDLLANLARRVTSLERQVESISTQLRDTQNNVEKLAQELAMVKNQTDCNEGDIAMLDERVIAIEESSKPVTINTQNVTINEDADIRKLAEKLHEALKDGAGR